MVGQALRADVSGGSAITSSKRAKLLLLWDRFLYPTISASVNSLQVGAWSRTWLQRATNKVGLNFFIWTFFWGWYMAVYKFAMPSMQHTSVENCAKNWLQLSPGRLLGRSDRKTQCFGTALATSCAAVVRESFVPTSFERWAVTTNDSLLPFSKWICGPRMTVLIYVNGWLAENSYSSEACFRVMAQSLAQDLQSFPTSYVCTLIDGQ